MGNNYTQVYDPAEISEISIDLGMGILVTFTSFVAIIGLILIWNWFHKKVKGR